MRSMAYGLSALSPSIGVAEEFIEKKGIPDEQLPAFLAKLGDPQLAGLIAQKQRLKQLQAKMPPPGGPQAAPPTVKDDINMEVMRALNPTPNNPQPQAGQPPGMPPQGAMPPQGGQPGMPPQGAQPPQDGQPPVQAAGGGLMGYGLGGLDAGAMEAPRHFDGGGVVAFAGPTGSAVDSTKAPPAGYRYVTDTTTAEKEANLAGIPMSERWTTDKEAEWTRLEQLRKDASNIKARMAYAPGASAQGSDLNTLGLWSSQAPRYAELNSQRDAALQRQQYTPKIKEAEAKAKYRITSPSTDIAPPAEEKPSLAPDLTSESSKVTAETKSGSGIPSFNFSTNPELYKDLEAAQEKEQGAYSQLYKDVKESKPSLLEEDTEALRYQRETADVSLEKAKEAYERAMGHGALGSASKRIREDAQRGLDTRSIIARGIGAWADARDAAYEAKQAADKEYRDQIQKTLEAEQVRKDSNTKESQTFAREQLVKLGEIAVKQAESARLFANAKETLKQQDKANKINEYQAQSGRISAVASRDQAADYRKEQLRAAEEGRMAQAEALLRDDVDKFRTSLGGMRDPKTNKAYTPEQIEVMVRNYRTDQVKNNPLLKKYALESAGNEGYGVMGVSK